MPLRSNSAEQRARVYTWLVALPLVLVSACGGGESPGPNAEDAPPTGPQTEGDGGGQTTRDGGGQEPLDSGAPESGTPDAGPDAAGPTSCIFDQSTFNGCFFQ